MARRTVLGFFTTLIAVCAWGGASAAITLHIEMNPDPPRPGEVIRTQLTVANNGISAVASVSLRMTMPAGLDIGLSPLYMSVGPSGCNATGPTSSCDPGDVMTFSLGAIAAGGAVTVSVPFVVAAATPAGTVIALDADVIVATVVTASASDSVTVDDNNALSLALDEDVNGVASGGMLTYTLTYANRAVATASGVSLSMPLPAGATLVSATGGGTAAGGFVSWNLGTLRASESGRQQAVVMLPGTLVAGDVVTVGSATVTGTVLAAAESARAQAATVVGGGILGVAVEMNPDPVRANERLRTQITVTNLSGAQASGVAIRARVPEDVVTFSTSAISGPSGVGISNCSSTGPSSSCDARDLIFISIGNMAAGSVVTLNLPPVVAAATADGRLLTWETLVTATTLAGAIQALASHTAAVESNNALTLAVDEDLDPIPAGAPLTYDLTYANRSGGSVTGTTLAFPVPAGASVTDAGGGTVAGGLISWNLGTLLAGESGRRQVVVTAGAGLGEGTLLRLDAATIDGTGNGPEHARGTAATSVRNSQPLGLAVAANPDPVRSDERLLTTVTVTNHSATQVTNVLLKMRVPDNVVAFIASAVNVPPSGCNVTGPGSGCDPGDLATMNLGNLAPGASAVITLPPLVAGATGDGVLLVWEAIVTSDALVNASNMRRTAAVDNGAPLMLGIDDSLDAVAPDGTLTYNLTDGNRGIATITGTTLRLPLPSATTFVSASDGAALVGNEVQWNLGNLPAGQSGRRQATVALNGAPGEGALLVVNAASIAGTGAATEVGRATEATAVRSGQALGLAIEANPDPVRQNEQLRTEIAVTNRTGAPLSNVTLWARVPDGVVAFSNGYVTSPAVATGCNLTGTGACDGGDLILFNIATLAAGAGMVISLPPFVANGTEDGRLLTWEAVAVAAGNVVSTATHHVAVDNDNALTLAMDDTPNDAPADGVLTYVLTYGNRSPASVTGATLRFPVPGGTTLLSSTGGTLAGDVLTFNLGTIAAGQGGRRQLRVQLGAGLPAGSLIYENGPQITATGSAGLETSRASEVTPVEAAATLPGLFVTSHLSPNPASPGTALTGLITVSNNTGADLTSVVVRVRQPDYTTTIAPGAISLSQGTVSGCNVTGGSANCDATDKVTWSVGALTNGAVATFSMPPAVTTGGGAPADGQLMVLYADASEQTSTRFGSASDTLLVGTFTDGDTDGIPNVFDNCLNVANPDQRDTDFDGFGNLCDGDLNNSLGLVNFADLALFRQVFGTSGTPAAADADFNGSGGLVNFADLAIFRALFGLPPGPSALAP